MSGRRKVVLVGSVVVVPVALVLGLLVLFVAAVANGAAGHDKEGASAPAAGGTPEKVAGIDPVMLSAYSRAAAQVNAVRPKCKGMRWSVIAGIGKIESNHAAGHTIAADGNITPRILGVRLNGSGIGGNHTTFTDTDRGQYDGDTSYDRAVGPMQFLPSTWNGPTGQDGNNDGVKNPHNAFDAALGTAAYLCGTATTDLSKAAQLRKAIYRYNHSNTYVDDVTKHITEYDALPAGTGSGGAATGRAGAVVNAAHSAIGTPYVWGGGSTSGPTKGGYDCSGLMLYAFHKGAGVTLPRTSQQMRHTGTHVSRAEMRPGDLIVINNDGNWGHVGLYTGNHTMIHAPRPGKTVETTSLAGYWEKYDWDVRRVL
ncbi:bifunctional lytic transglycosylase/C40 family peptidase [Streptomyces sp. NBC_01789]|uniref:C40 family peptidase n=1 Tax=Streptomyces sp. NBC_01789 TaxID=2975941 RepID=UPI002251669A|nr:bifunctional lytic transglycosylase/C40 family peptidase [Streptomyces sp. NBC_01789]MCX4451708.1 bifunctional lytic transglycosylase/C40 family peptidase [Streptomyces sp. NBC_01789]